MNKYKIILLSLFIANLVFLSFAYANENWMAEFDYVCGKTEESMDMSIEELKDMVDRCKRLKPLIENSEHPQKKILLKRLENCKKLYIYMIDVRTQQGK